MSNSHVHPTMTQVIDSFFQAVGAADTPATPGPALAGAMDFPPLPKGLKRERWTPPDGLLPDLVVDYLEWDAAPGKRDEWGQAVDPDYPAGVEIQAVWIGPYDIYLLLADQIVDRIEKYLCPAEE